MGEVEKTRDMALEIAKLIGEPINTRLPVPVEISAIADTYTAAAGEKVWRYTNVDKDSDYILDVDSAGKITVIKKAVLGDTELTFKGLNSRQEYLLVDDVLNSPDVNVLARKKEAIARGLDKRELKIILDGIIAGTNVPSNQGILSYDAVSADDLYDTIIAMKHKVEDYGDNYVLLVGTAIKEALDTYDKDNIGSFNYNLGIYQQLKNLNIEVVKIFGKVDSGSGDTVLLNTNFMILLAKNSRISKGKPIKFIRRIINADIARLMGANVDSAQRAVIISPTPVPVDISGVTYNLLAYSTYAYESVVFCITNPLGIVLSDATLALI